MNSLNKPKFATIQAGNPIKTDINEQFYMNQAPNLNIPIANQSIGNNLMNNQINNNINRNDANSKSPQNASITQTANKPEPLPITEIKKDDESEYDSDLDVFVKEVKKEEPKIEGGNEEEESLSSITNESGNNILVIFRAF
jgi:hypothetical protein